MRKAAGKRIENKPHSSPPHRFSNGFAWNFSCMSRTARSGAAAGGHLLTRAGSRPARGGVEVGMGRSAASHPGPVWGARTAARSRRGRTENRPGIWRRFGAARSPGPADRRRPFRGTSGSRARGGPLRAGRAPGRARGCRVWPCRAWLRRGRPGSVHESGFTPPAPVVRPMAQEVDGDRDAPKFPPAGVFS